MKKIILVTALLASMGAHSADFGINTSRDTANSDRIGYGITVGQKYDKVGITAGFDQYKSGTDLNKYSLVASYDVANFGATTVAVKAGVAYLDQKNTTDGYAALVGAGVSYPLSKQVALTADYRYQAGQSRISSLDGNSVSAGLKYSF
jgi:outer membrane autotransporter protein